MKMLTKIEFEGTDGAGKTTALKYFIDQARAQKINVVETREVGNPAVPACVKLREFVLDPANKLRGETMELIFSGMRFENDQWLDDLRENMTEKTLVVSDRGWLSHLAYTDHNVSEKFTEKLFLNLVGPSTSKPDVIIYFSVNTETALKRRVKRGGSMDVIELKGVEFQEKVRGSFLKYLENYEGLVYMVDANKDLEDVKSQIDDILADLTD